MKRSIRGSPKSFRRNLFKIMLIITVLAAIFGALAMPASVYASEGVGDLRPH